MGDLVDLRGLPVLVLHEDVDAIDLTCEEFRVYVHLVQRARKPNASMPPVQELGDTCFLRDYENAEVRKKHVIAALKALVAKGMLARRKRFDSETGAQLASVNELLPRDAWSAPLRPPVGQNGAPAGGRGSRGARDEQASLIDSSPSAAFQRTITDTETGLGTGEKPGSDAPTPPVTLQSPGDSTVTPPSDSRITPPSDSTITPPVTVQSPPPVTPQSPGFGDAPPHTHARARTHARYTRVDQDQDLTTTSDLDQGLDQDQEIPTGKIKTTPTTTYDPSTRARVTPASERVRPGQHSLVPNSNRRREAAGQGVVGVVSLPTVGLEQTQTPVDQGAASKRRKQETQGTGQAFTSTSPGAAAQPAAQPAPAASGEPAAAPLPESMPGNMPENMTEAERRKAAIMADDAALKARVAALKQQGEQDNLSRAYAFYENNFGALTQYLGEELADFVETYGIVWVMEAMKTAVMAEKRKLSYVHGILRNWYTNGLPDNIQKRIAGETIEAEKRALAALTPFERAKLNGDVVGYEHNKKWN